MTENISGECSVNGVVLNNMSRYLLAKHPESLSKADLKRSEKHLKDCEKCREEIAKQKG